MTISQQLDDLSAFLGMELGLVFEMHRALDANTRKPVSANSSLITIAGYENGKPVIGHIEVVPSRQRNTTSYTTTNKAIDVASDRLVFKVYGVRDVAMDILDHPEKLQSDRSILGKYRASMHATAGQDLSADELKQLASRLEELTAARYPNIVGREQEIAVFENGKITSFHALNPDEYELTGNEYNRALIGNFPHGKMSGKCGERKTSQGVRVDGIGQYLILLDEGQFRCLYQPIDKLVVTNSNFDDCLLYYGGDPISYFGSNNIIANSTLILGPNVSDDSSFVRNFRTLYPDVPIKKGTSDVR